MQRPEHVNQQVLNESSMSHEQPPIRSRRELRKARDAQQAAAAGNNAHDDGQAPPAPGRPAAGVRTAPEHQSSSAPQAPAKPTPSAKPTSPAEPQSPPARQTPAERSSQVRARDRATLRAIKEMEEKETQLSAGGPVTRRQLRLQQLKEQALTGLNTVVPQAGTEVRPAAADKDSTVREDVRQGTGAGPEPQGMTVEQALAARSLIAEQARNQIAKMEHIASLDPEAVHPDILAEQIALAERAAVMNRRAMARQKLAEQASAPPQPRDAAAKERQAPSTATNLAMVTPLEFVQVPGVDRPVMQPPATSYVPVTTHPGTRVPAREGNRPAAPDNEPGAGTPQRPPVRAAGASGPKRSHMIARAEAAARAAGGAQPARPAPKPVAQEHPVVAERPVQQPAPEPLAEDLFEDVPRVPAASAYGLEPLDAATAGLARANRNRMLQIFVLALGIVALIAGIVLIISGFSG